MVGITKVQRANARYWIEAVADGAEDYYSKPGEAPGEWLGEQAEELGLQGRIDRAAYAAVLEGRDPSTGRMLVRRRRSAPSPTPPGASAPRSRCSPTTSASPRRSRSR